MHVHTQKEPKGTRADQIATIWNLFQLYQIPTSYGPLVLPTQNLVLFHPDTLQYPPPIPQRKSKIKQTHPGGEMATNETSSGSQGTSPNTTAAAGEPLLSLRRLSLPPPSLSPLCLLSLPSAFSLSAHNSHLSTGTRATTFFTPKLMVTDELGFAAQAGPRIRSRGVAGVSQGTQPIAPEKEEGGTGQGKTHPSVLPFLSPRKDSSCHPPQPRQPRLTDTRMSPGPQDTSGSSEARPLND